MLSGLSFCLWELAKWRLEGTPEDVCEAVEWQVRWLYARMALD